MNGTWILSHKTPLAVRTRQSQAKVANLNLLTNYRNDLRAAAKKKAEEEAKKKEEEKASKNKETTQNTTKAQN